MTRKPEQIISDQVHFWEHLRKTEMRGATPPPFWHSITVSRAFGANGSAQAAELAHRTGVSVWDKALVQAIAAVRGAHSRHPTDRCAAGRIVKSRRSITREETVRFPERPFMVPALRKEAPKFPDLWEGSVQ